MASAKTLVAGIIDIGSHSVRMEIFEIRPGGAFEALDSASQTLNLGQDVFRRGVVAPESVNLLCRIMRQFKRKFEEYGVKVHRTVGTSALREAENRELVIDRVRFESGLEIEILEPQEEIELYFTALRAELLERMPEEEATGVGFIVGTGSLLVFYFEKRILRFSEAAPIGSVRTIDEFGHGSWSVEQMIENLSSMNIRRRLAECVELDPARPLLLIGMGAGVRMLARDAAAGLSGDAARLAAEKAMRAEPEDILRQQSCADFLALSIPSCGALLNYFLQEFVCSRFYASKVSTRSALAAELVRRRREEDVFFPDLVAGVEGVANKYGVELEGARATAVCALKLYDKLRRNYSFSPKSRILLQLAALLHDIGHFVDVRQHHKHSYYLIMHTQLPGIRERDQKIIAGIARYHRKGSPHHGQIEYGNLCDEDRVTVLKLSAILRVADAITQLEQKTSFKLELHGSTLTIRAATLEGMWFSPGYLQLKSGLFKEVFGLEIKLEEIPVRL